MAWYQGLLQQKDLNVFQRFAAQYQIRRNRERLVQDIEDTLQRQTWYQHPDRYDALFLTDDQWSPDPLTMAGRPVEEVVDDLDEHDAYFAALEDQRTMTGAEVAAFSSGEGGWV